MATVFTNIRKLIKQTGSDKLIAIKYTPKQFTIVKRTNPRVMTLERRRYQLANMQGEMVTLANGNIKPFFGIDLQKVMEKKDDLSTITTERALTINKILKNRNDVNIYWRFNKCIILDGFLKSSQTS